MIPPCPLCTLRFSPSIRIIMARVLSSLMPTCTRSPTAQDTFNIGVVNDQNIVFEMVITIGTSQASVEILKPPLEARSLLLRQLAFVFPGTSGESRNCYSNDIPPPRNFDNAEGPYTQGLDTFGLLFPCSRHSPPSRQTPIPRKLKR